MILFPAASLGEPNPALHPARSGERDRIGLILLNLNLLPYAGGMGAEKWFPTPFIFNGLEADKPQRWPAPPFSAFRAGISDAFPSRKVGRESRKQNTSSASRSPPQSLQKLTLGLLCDLKNCELVLIDVGNNGVLDQAAESIWRDSVRLAAEVMWPILVCR